MNDIQIGRRFRALRHRLGWRQVDLAARSNVSHSVISLVERGRLERVTLRNLRRIARELEAEFASNLWWRGGDLDRLVDEDHARLAGRVVELLTRLGWVVKVEVSYAIYGERGSIDVLAWHPGARIVLVVEVKTELVSVEETLRKHDEKARLARTIGRDRFGWDPVGVARLLVLPTTATARRQIERHGPLLAPAYPKRTHDVRRWLAGPDAAAAGVLFIDAEGERRGDERGVAMRAKRIRGRSPRRTTTPTLTA